MCNVAFHCIEAKPSKQIRESHLISGIINYWHFLLSQYYKFSGDVDLTPAPVLKFGWSFESAHLTVDSSGKY